MPYIIMNLIRLYLNYKMHLKTNYNLLKTRIIIVIQLRPFIAWLFCDTYFKLKCANFFLKKVCK